MKKQHKKEMLTRKQNEAKEAERRLELERKWKQEKREKDKKRRRKEAKRKRKRQRLEEEAEDDEDEDDEEDDDDNDDDTYTPGGEDSEKDPGYQPSKEERQAAREDDWMSQINLLIMYFVSSALLI